MKNCALKWSDWWDAPLRSETVLDRGDVHYLKDIPFLSTAREAQRPPVGDWRTWLLMGGRGAGKTRAGAEWARFSALYGGCKRIALVGPTLGDVREVMIEGPSGLRAIEPDDEKRPIFNVSRRRVEWPNGAVGLVFSAEDPESLRGPQFDAAWCDEIAVWSKGERVWDNLQFGLRLGDDPRCVATTTPRPVPLVRRLVGGGAVVTHSPTQDNAAHLAPGFVEQMETAYSGTVLGRQELGGELIEDPESALWKRSDFEVHRLYQSPARFDDIIVAIDPPATSGPASDACGIIAAGRANADGFGEKCFVLADASARGLKPADWAARTLACALEVGASGIVAESNQGGEMVRSVLESAGCDLPVRLVHARLSKRARAAPVAALYSHGRISHLGVLSALEDEMCRFGVEGFVGSPDRVDALVWAVTALMLEQRQAPRIRRL